MGSEHPGSSQTRQALTSEIKEQEAKVRLAEGGKINDQNAQKQKDIEAKLRIRQVAPMVLCCPGAV